MFSSIPRIAQRDTELGGVVIPKNFASANRTTWPKWCVATVPQALHAAVRLAANNARNFPPICPLSIGVK
ncbi:hypothetical protein CI1B_26190 [Bradyrhizobium ivorense]|uniref:Uncharacterized protein n=1 Tax=Bradyrhizobium ivorense TaxID=2511166 RepID=A0A508T1Y0_9BRAD|nr:hypothetical protein [Bradyrhizobium ivorense]VIO69098.1 hypothetical protein CI41S_17530 [Bradyrhizobium ivorense]VIO69322.1 hypothetical protein CI1B_26190 [Bradyrhizobium ivorense]